jgi:hypothetical protein
MAHRITYVKYSEIGGTNIHCPYSRGIQVYAVLVCDDLPKSDAPGQLVHPTGLSVQEVQHQKQEEWN